MEFGEYMKKLTRVLELMQQEGLDEEHCPPKTMIWIDEEGLAINILLERSGRYHYEWIEGEGSDIGLYRDMETKKLVGARLPLKHLDVEVSYTRKK